MKKNVDFYNIKEIYEPKINEVLFFALSTFRLSKNTSSLEGPYDLLYEGEKIDDYYYQLEPVLKLFRHIEKTPVAVVMLSTTETQKKKKYYVNDKEYETTPEEYMEKMIKDLWPETEVKAIFIKEKEDLSADEDPETKETPEVKEKKHVTLIKEVLEKVRELNNNYKGIRLSIDIHGGLRDTQMIIQSIVSLIRYEEVKIGEIYSIHFDNVKADIYEADNTIDIGQFVMGMNELLLYGRGYSLERYYDKVHGDKRLATIIKNISDSIQLCHVSDFDDAINRMRKYLGEYEEKGDYTDVFVETIRKSYGELLAEDEKEKNKAFNKVKWCLKNDFIQQALTIIESHMPAQFFESGIIRYSTNGENQVQLRDKHNNPGPYITISDAIQNSKSKFDYSYTYSFTKWANKCIRWRVQPKLTLKGVNIDNYTRWDVENIQLDETVQVTINRGRYRSYSYPLGISLNDRIVTNEDKRKNVIRLLKLHLLLKDERNNTNHSDNGKRASLEEVKTALNAYVQLCEKVFKEDNDQEV